jgi:hypothetical protein
MSVIEEPVKTPVVDDCAVLRFAALGYHALPARAAAAGVSSPLTAAKSTAHEQAL